MIRIVLPYHLRALARVDGEVLLEVKSPVTLSAVLDALEAHMSGHGVQIVGPCDDGETAGA